VRQILLNYRRTIPKWTNDVIHRICRETGLRYQSVYKWQWDETKREIIREKEIFQLEYIRRMNRIEESEN
jgi:hypothetical protein